MTRCGAWMILPPQREGVRLRCVLDVHPPKILHEATDPNNVVRRWPSSGPAADAAGHDSASGLGIVRAHKRGEL